MNVVAPAPPCAVVLGTGFIGPVHVEALRRAGVDVVGILGSRPEKSLRAAEALRLETAFASLDEVLADPRVTCVHVATPNRHHFEQVSRALRAGKHVLCEKPLAMNSQESAELVRLARQTGLVAGVNYNLRFYPLCCEARHRVAAGELGRVLHVHGSYVQDWLLRDTDFNWRVLAEEGGQLRAVADIGTHWIDLVQYITGLKVEAVFADLSTVHPRRYLPSGDSETFSGSRGGSRAEASQAVAVETEDVGHVLLRFDGGARGSLVVSQVNAGRKNCLRLEVAGQKEALAWNSEVPNELWSGHRDSANQCLLKDPSLLSEAARRYTDYPGGHNEGFPDSHKQCFRAFYDYIAGGQRGTPEFATFEDGHREIVFCEAVWASHSRQQWVKLDAGGVD